MKRGFLPLASLLLAATNLNASDAAALAPGAAAQAPKWTLSDVRAPRLQHRTFDSAAAKTKVSFFIYTPKVYDAEKERRFPVMYWLHGTGGGLAGVPRLAAHFDSAIEAGKLPPMLVVFANGLTSSMWCDSKDGRVPMETMVVKELVPHVDATFRTIASRAGRLVEGFSMGGYGAARLGFKYPDVFGAVSILAGGPLDLEFKGPRATAKPEERERILQTVYGGDLNYFKAQSPWVLAERNAAAARDKTRVRMVTGERDSTLELNRRFSEHLKKLNIPHTFNALPGVDHNTLALLNALGDENWQFYRAVFGKDGQRTHGKQPNILLILADDLGWSDVGCYGGEIPTPNIDLLAKGGLRFTQFYNNAVCGPSRASLLTGLYAQRIGHTGAHWNQPTDFHRCITLGEALQRAGYHTMMVGKWQDPDLPAKRGFHRFFGPMCAGKVSYFNEVQLNPFYLDTRRVKLPDDFYFTDALTDHALKFLDDRATKSAAKRKPFFLYVAHIAPHWPLHAREADIAPHRARYREHGWDEWRAERLKFQRANGLVPAAWPLSPRPATVHAWAGDKFKDWQAERMAVYAAQVASIDRSTGQILDALRERGELENTLVLFMSDNGAAPDGGVKPSIGGFGFRPRSSWRLDGKPMRVASGPDVLPGPADTFAAYGLAWATTSNTPFRSTKLTGYEGGIRTPLIAHWPAGIAARGKIVNDAGHFIDLMPTFLELAGAKYPKALDGRKPLPLDGRSLAPVFRGEPLGARGFLAWRVPQHRAFRVGDWKIISKTENSAWELYDLARDGTETTNLAAQHPDIVKDLAAKWQQWVAGCSAKPQ